jgi:hypothetical protein
MRTNGQIILVFSGRVLPCSTAGYFATMASLVGAGPSQATNEISERKKNPVMPESLLLIIFIILLIIVAQYGVSLICKIILCTRRYQVVSDNYDFEYVVTRGQLNWSDFLVLLGSARNREKGSNGF